MYDETAPNGPIMVMIGIEGLGNHTRDRYCSDGPASSIEDVGKKLDEFLEDFSTYDNVDIEQAVRGFITVRNEIDDRDIFSIRFDNISLHDVWHKTLPSYLQAATEEAEREYQRKLAFLNKRMSSPDWLKA